MSDAPMETMKDLAPAYALGMLEDDERAAFERALATDPSLALELAAFRETAGLIGESVMPLTPPASLRARVLATTPVASRDADVLPFRPAAAAADATAPASEPRAGNFVWWAALAASVALLAVSAFQLRSTRADLAAAEATAADRARATDSLALRLAAKERTLAALLAPGVQLVRLAPGGAAASSIQLFINPATRRVVIYASNLPSAGQGKTYQLWFIREGEAPIPSVTFDTDANGTGLVESIESPEGALPALAAVTVEPAGGSASPTLPIVLSGALTR